MALEGDRGAVTNCYKAIVRGGNLWPDVVHDWGDAKERRLDP